MKTFLLLIAVALCPTLFVGQEQTPVIFDLAHVVVGAKRVPTLYLHTSGRWSDAEKGASILSADMDCYQIFGICEEAMALPGGSVVLFSWDIIHWDARELVAEDSSAPCVVVTVRADFVTKGVTKTMALKGGVKDHSCDGFQSSGAFLGGAKDELKKIQPKERK
jgi:hypothetical protein